MSVGGKVIEVIQIKPDKVWVNTLDHGVECGVLCDPAGNNIQIGDTVWWHGDCRWTPKFGTVEDVRLKKIGASGISKRQANLMLANGGELPGPIKTVADMMLVLKSFPPDAKIIYKRYDNGTSETLPVDLGWYAKGNTVSVTPGEE